MIVKFRNTFIWGGGTHTGKMGSPPSNMRRYRSGEPVQVPDALFPYLPKTAEVIEAPKTKGNLKDLEAAPETNELHTFDPLRGAAEIEAAVHEQGNRAVEETKRRPGRPRKSA